MGGGGGSQGLHISSSGHNNYTVTVADLLATFTTNMERLHEVNGGATCLLGSNTWEPSDSSPVPTLSPQTTSPGGPSSMKSSPLLVLYIWLERPQDLRINKNQVGTKSRSNSNGFHLNSSGDHPGPKCIIFLLRGMGGAILAAHWLSWAPGDTWLTPSFTLLPYPFHLFLLVNLSPFSHPRADLHGNLVWQVH